MRLLTQIIIGCFISITLLSIGVYPIHDEIISERTGQSVGELSVENRGNGGDSYARRKRASGPFDLIAGISGGSVIHTDKDNISSAIDLLTSRLANQVIILRQQLKVNNTTQYSFYVDSSVKQLGIKAETSCCKPNVVLQDPAGKRFTKSSVDVTVTVDTTNTFYALLNGTITTGLWTVVINDSHVQDYDVTIYGSSLISFSQDFCDSMGNSVSGQPISEINQTYVKITPSGIDLTSNWTYFILKTTNGTQLQQLPFGELKGSRTNKVYLLQVKWPNMDVHVGVQGLDSTGNIFTRELPTLIQPLGVRLHLDNTDIGYITSCETPTILAFTVTNLLSTYQNITCEASSSNLKFQASVSQDHFRLASHQTKNASVVVTLLSSPSPAESTDIFISALTSEKKAQYATKTLITRNVICKTATHGYEVSTNGYQATDISDKTIVATTTGSGTVCLRSTMTVMSVMCLLLVLL